MKDTPAQRRAVPGDIGSTLELSKHVSLIYFTYYYVVYTT